MPAELYVMSLRALGYKIFAFPLVQQTSALDQLKILNMSAFPVLTSVTDSFCLGSVQGGE